MGEQVAVASSVFNMAGPESKRIHFLKSLIISGIMEETPSLGELISEGYRNGPAMRFRRFSRWAKKDPQFREYLGITSGSLKVPKSIDMAALKATLLPLVDIPPGSDIHIESAQIDGGNILFWAQRHLLEHYPQRQDESWVCDYDDEAGEVVVTFPDTTEIRFSPQAPAYSPVGQYLYVSFTPILPEESTVLEEGNPEPVSSFPDTTGWQQLQSTITPRSRQLQGRIETVVKYSDGRPDEVSTQQLATRTANYQEIEARYQKDDYLGADDPGRDSISSQRRFWTFRQTATVQETAQRIEHFEEVEPGVYANTTITTFRDNLILRKTVQEDTQKVHHRTWLPLQTLIYRQGGGHPELDVFFATEQAEGSFYPVIPFRYNNTPITKKPYRWRIRLPFDYHNAVYTRIIRIAASDGQRERRLRGRIVQWQDGHPEVVVEDYQNGDRSLAEMVGKPNPVAQLWVKVSDDTEETPWYPIQPLQAIEPSETLKKAYAVCRKAFHKAYDADYDEVLRSIMQHDNLEDIDHAYAMFGVSLNVEENACRKYVYLFLRHLMEHAPMTPQQQADWESQWQRAEESQQRWSAWKSLQANWIPGQPRTPEPLRFPFPIRPLKRLDVKADRHKEGLSNFHNQYLWHYIYEEQGTGKLKDDAKQDELWFERLGGYHADSKFTLNWQVTTNSWRRLTVVGLQHRNLIYKDNAVTTWATDALLDTEESGFIIPFHEDIYHGMKLIDRTQMATACCFLVFNCYEVKKTSFWEKWGAIIILAVVVLVAVAVTVATGGAAGIGLLGSAEAVGGFFGASGVAGLIVGSAVNALAGIIIGILLTEVSVELFGDEWGRWIGWIATTVVLLGISSYVNSVDLIQIFTSPEGIAQLSSMATQGGTMYLEQKARELAESIEEIWEESTRELKEIQKLLEDLSPSSQIDLKTMRQYVSELLERPEQFLSRTLLTGSDIVEMHLGLLDNFAKHTLNTELP